MVIPSSKRVHNSRQLKRIINPEWYAEYLQKRQERDRKRKKKAADRRKEEGLYEKWRKNKSEYERKRRQKNKQKQISAMDNISVSGCGLEGDAVSVSGLEGDASHDVPGSNCVDIHDLSDTGSSSFPIQVAVQPHKPYMNNMRKEATPKPKFKCFSSHFIHELLKHLEKENELDIFDATLEENDHIDTCQTCISNIRNEKKEIKFGIINGDKSCSISSALCILRACKPYLPDMRIQAYFDHCDGRELKPFNPFHVLKWIGLKRGKLGDLGEMLSRIITYTDDDTFGSQFQIQTTSLVHCMTCSKSSSPIQGVHTILPQYLASGSFTEKLQDENSYNCNTCGTNVPEAIRTEDITHSPACLLLCINRFRQQKRSMKKDCSPYTYKEILTIKENDKDISYSLQAVGCHRGRTVNNGHYETYVKNGSTWTLISDCHVQEDVSITEVLSHKQIAYILGYKKSNIL